MLTAAPDTSRRQLAMFALFTLGVIDCLEHRLLSATEAVRLFFNADNCLFARKRLREKSADEIMSRGVQLPDLYDALPAAKARREFARELSTMRALCVKLLEEKHLVA
jgi:hypothetical protein